MVTDIPPRKKHQLFLDSDRMQTLPLPANNKLLTVAGAIQTAMHSVAIEKQFVILARRNVRHHICLLCTTRVWCLNWKARLGGAMGFENAVQILTTFETVGEN